MRSVLNRIEEVQSVQLSPYADVYTLTFRPGVTPNEAMVRKVFKGCAFTGRTVEFIEDPDAPRAAPDAPPANVATTAQVALGRRLFLDKRLSADGNTACSTCHQSERAFTNGRAAATGVRGREMLRNVPTLFNVGYRQTIFWDGHAETLEKMAFGALKHPAVMDLTPDELSKRLRSIPEYAESFRLEYGEAPTAQSFSLALAAYMRSLLSDDTPFDRFARGDSLAISESALRGWKVFCDKANCITCHAGPDFTDEEFRTIGIGWNGKAYADLGRAAITGESNYAGMFRVPTLRELRWTAPYMHDGSLKTLEEVVDHYDRGGTEGAPTDLKGPLKLTTEDKRDLVAFLESLSSTKKTAKLPDAVAALRSR